jgi:hypothetical protein
MPNFCFCPNFKRANVLLGYRTAAAAAKHVKLIAHIPRMTIIILGSVGKLPEL